MVARAVSEAGWLSRLLLQPGFCAECEFQYMTPALSWLAGTKARIWVMKAACSADPAQTWLPHSAMNTGMPPCERAKLTDPAVSDPDVPVDAPNAEHPH